MEDNVKKGRVTAISCNKGFRRTNAALYLLHRRMDATHEEALAHSKVPNAPEPFSEGEKEHLRQLFEERAKYEKPGV